MNQNLTSILKDTSLEDSSFTSIKKGKEAIVEALVLPGKLKDLHISIQNLRNQVEGVQSIVYEDIEYQQDWTKFSVDKVVKVRLEDKQAIGFQKLMNIDENELMDEVNDLFSSRYSLNSMMVQKGPRLMYFENHVQQLRSDVKIKEIRGTVTNEQVNSFLTFQGFKTRRKEITSGILYPFDFGEEIFIYRRRLKQISAKKTALTNNAVNENLNSAVLNLEGKQFLVLDENVNDYDDDGSDDDEDMEGEKEAHDRRKYYYCIIFRKRIGDNESDEVAIEHVINFSKCFQDYFIVHNKQKNL